MPVDAPRVSVITSVHNGERFLAAAIESILAQHFTNFEYLLLDDASTDGSAEIIARYAAVDTRIFPLHKPFSINHSHALNAALPHARGEFVAILDADDLAHPERLARQVTFLTSHPDVGVVGAQVNQIDDDGRICKAMTFPTSWGLARWAILFGTPVLHSAAMMRRALLDEIGGYSVQWKYANDYSLWATLINRTRIRNLAETLVSYRRHAQQTSSTTATPQQGEVWLLIYRMLAERLGLRPPLNDIGLLYHGVRGMQLDDAATLLRVADLLMTIRERYLAVEEPDPATAEAITAECARRLLMLAWTHRRQQRLTSRALLERALELDPHLWKRPQTWSTLRAQHRRDAYT
ncbi:glycosyltransferase [Candidatus Chloroploca sp. Khr17]|uniref:glycosyltransferase n=1 Tax=Candidatus Chloroploca sp. Khr17 TaxID=2496869 RepID=UPI00101D9C3D|nr:glycosyltransferase [Candidatus Chloroploca sp. Khr17]